MTVGTTAPALVLAQDGEGRPVRLQALSTTRIVGALLVVVSHSGIVFGLLGPGNAREPFRLVGLALAPVVSYFFVLTGFVITWSYADRLRPLTFYRGRAARLLPTNLLWWGLGCLVILWYHVPISHLGAFMTFFMLQSWVFDSNVVLTANPAAWSLSVDVLFYALFPLLLPIVVAIPRKGRLVLAGLLVLVQVQNAVVTDMHDPAGFHYLYNVAYLPVARLPEFLLGMIAALEIRAGRLPRISLRWASWGAVGMMVLIRVVTEHHQAYEWSALAALPSVILISALAQSDVEGKKSWLTTPALTKAGNWTFALYMLQIPVMRVIDKLAGQPIHALPEYGLAAGTAVLCVVLAWAQYTYFEQPLDKLIRGRKTRPDPVPATAP